MKADTVFNPSPVPSLAGDKLKRMNRIDRIAASRLNRHIRNETRATIHCPRFQLRSFQQPKRALVRDVSPPAVACVRVSTGKGALRPLGVPVNVDPKIFSQILYDKRISAHAFRLWHLLRDRLGNNTCAWPGYRRIRKDMGCGNSTIRAALTELEKAGYIRVKAGGPQKSSEYYLLPVTEKSAPVEERSVTKRGSPPAPMAGAELIPSELISEKEFFSEAAVKRRAEMFAELRKSLK